MAGFPESFLRGAASAAYRFPEDVEAARALTLALPRAYAPSPAFLHWTA